MNSIQDEDPYSQYFDKYGKCLDIVGYLLQEFEDRGISKERGKHILNNVLFLEDCLKKYL